MNYVIIFLKNLLPCNTVDRYLMNLKYLIATYYTRGTCGFSDGDGYMESCFLVYRVDGCFLATRWDSVERDHTMPRIGTDFVYELRVIGNFFETIVFLNLNPSFCYS